MLYKVLKVTNTEDFKGYKGEPVIVTEDNGDLLIIKNKNGRQWVAELTDVKEINPLAFILNSNVN